MARKEADGQSGRAVRADERRGGEERMDAFDVEGEDAAADDDEDAWRVARMVALFSSSSFCWGEQRARRGLSARKSRRERKKENETQRKKRGREEAVATRSLSSYRNQKKCTNRFSLALSFFPLFFVYTTALTAASPPNKQAPASIATRAEGLDSAAGGTFLLCQARVAAAERQTATPVSRHERQSEVLLFWSSFIPLSLSRRSISSP